VRRTKARALARDLPSALILAAGGSSRFLGTKQLAEVGGRTIIERVLDAVPNGCVRETVVVLGHEARAVAGVVRRREGVRVVVNADYRSGMASSIRAGMLAVSKDTPGVLILLADQPFVTSSLLRREVEAFQAVRGGIVAAASGNLTTPPAIFSRRYFPELARLRGDRGARSVIERHPDAVSLVRARSRRELSDVDTREDLDGARRLLERREARKQVRPDPLPLGQARARP
jgi:molybdenum cofactor cytidylyltransferase